MSHFKFSSKKVQTQLIMKHLLRISFATNMHQQTLAERMTYGQEQRNPLSKNFKSERKSHFIRTKDFV